MSDISVGTLGGATTSSGIPSAAMQNLDKDTFLQLLVAQMKYQNPMDPVDSNQYLAQAAQYASVEQLENMAQAQAELRSMQMVTIATGLVGQEVTAVNGFTGEEITGVVETVKFGTEPILIVDGVEVPLSAVVSVTSSASDAADGEEATNPGETDPAAGEGTDPIAQAQTPAQPAGATVDPAAGEATDPIAQAQTPAQTDGETVDPAIATDPIAQAQTPAQTDGETVYPAIATEPPAQAQTPAQTDGETASSPTPRLLGTPR